MPGTVGWMNQPKDRPVVVWSRAVASTIMIVGSGDEKENGMAPGEVVV
jgi:hypothetical protein